MPRPHTLPADDWELLCLQMLLLGGAIHILSLTELSNQLPVDTTSPVWHSHEKHQQTEWRQWIQAYLGKWARLRQIWIVGGLESGTILRKSGSCIHENRLSAGEDVTRRGPVAPSQDGFLEIPELYEQNRHIQSFPLYIGNDLWHSMGRCDG